MKFADEEELEQWYSQEKEKLEEAAMEQMTSHPEKSDVFKKKYDEELKKLILNYQSQYSNLVDKLKNKKN